MNTFLHPHLRKVRKPFSGILLSLLLLLLLLTTMILIIGFTCPLTILFEFITKCNKCCYKVRWSGITKCDNFITKCDRTPPPPPPRVKIPWDFYWESKTYKLRRYINDLYGEVRGEREDCIRRRHI